MRRDEYGRIVCPRCGGRGSICRIGNGPVDTPCPSCHGRGYQPEEETHDMSGIPLKKQQAIELDLGPGPTPLGHLRALLAQFDDFESGASAFVKLRSPAPGNDKGTESRYLTIEVES